MKLPTFDCEEKFSYRTEEVSKSLWYKYLWRIVWHGVDYVVAEVKFAMELWVRSVCDFVCTLLLNNYNVIL